MAYLQTKIHHCGQRIEIHEFYGRLGYLLDSFVDGKPVTQCPKCHESLAYHGWDNDLFTDEEYELWKAVQ